MKSRGSLIKYRKIIRTKRRIFKAILTVNKSFFSSGFNVLAIPRVKILNRSVLTGRGKIDGVKLSGLVASKKLKLIRKTNRPKKVKRKARGAMVVSRKRAVIYKHQRGFVKVGPRLNLRIYALVMRLMKNGRKAKARRMVEKAMLIVLQTLAVKYGGKRLKSSMLILNSVLKTLEPPFDLRSISVRRGRKGKQITFSPFPIWGHRRYFLAAKFLVMGARKYKAVNRCSMGVALAKEIGALIFKKRGQISFTWKLFMRFINFGLQNQPNWRRLSRRLL